MTRRIGISGHGSKNNIFALAALVAMVVLGLKQVFESKHCTDILNCIEWNPWPDTRIAFWNVGGCRFLRGLSTPVKMNRFDMTVMPIPSDGS